MSVRATISIPAMEFPLGKALEVTPDATISVETMVPTQRSVMPYFWVPTEHAEEITAALGEDPVVVSVKELDTVDERTLIRIEWTDEVNGLVEAFVDWNAAVMDATGTGDDWTFDIRFPDYDALSGFYRQAVRNDVPVELTQIHDPATPERTNRYGLTANQHETLLTALDEGYFAVPRETTLVELADQIDISDSAVSQRIRRGLTTLISATLLEDTDAEFD
jgi:predicted DNA binding protein